MTRITPSVHSPLLSGRRKRTWWLVDLLTLFVKLWTYLSAYICIWVWVTRAEIWVSVVHVWTQSVCFMYHVYCMFPCRICKGCQLKSLLGTVMHNRYIFTSAEMIYQLKEQHKIIDRWFIKTSSVGHKWKYTKVSLCCHLFTCSGPSLE